MKNYKKDLLDKIISLYNMYERYIWRNDGVNLNILIQDKTIGFYLFSEKEDLDEIIFSFSGKENNLYKYVSVKILIEMIKDVVVRIDNNEIHNKMLKPYLRLIVNDDEILEIMKELVDRQLLETITDNTDLIKKINDSIINPIFYPNKFMRHLDERIALSRKLLKVGDR